MSFIENFKDATIGFSGYPRLARDKSSAFGYMALLLAIVLLISAIIMTVQFKRSTSSVVEDLKAGPDFALRNGEVFFDGPMPYEVKEGGARLIIDTTGQTTIEDLKKAGPNSMLVTKTEFHQIDAVGRIQSRDLSALTVTITKADLLAMMANVHWLVPLFYVLVYLAQLGFKALDALILGAIAVQMARQAKKPISLNLGFKLGLYAMSLPVVLQWLWPGFSTLSFTGFILWWGLALLYLTMGLRTYQRDWDREEIV